MLGSKPKNDMAANFVVQNQVDNSTLCSCHQVKRTKIVEGKGTGLLFNISLATEQV
jgi:hypothetical protein